MGVVQRNRVKVLGDPDGPVVMLAHGFGCDQSMWRLVIPRLTPRYRLVLFDYVGAGGSDLSAWSEERYSSLEGYARDVVEICEELDLRNVAFVGHSVSSMIGVLAARAAPDRIGALVMVTPSPCYIDQGDYHGGFTEEDIDELLASLDANYLGWSSVMAPVIMGNPERPELGDELTDSFCSTDPTMARVFAQTTFLSDNRDDLDQVDVPTLVVDCAHDAIAPPAVGAFVHDHIAGSRRVTLDANGHCPHLSHPDATADAVLDFLDRIR
ncbi:MULTISPECIES: alpha/beta hydrolase [Streptomyces]|uniref:alpha/beta fold hydrolase n=1 Tax=Streptomyces TaxID=1883 RepID=UPI000AB8771B|nr:MULTISPECIES: alpha/beta hydrolase [Streptomyces]MDH6228292.1 sigma-B regulation protein RsbQ [Streptomyces sp. MJP52]